MTRTTKTRRIRPAVPPAPDRSDRTPLEAYVDGWKAEPLSLSVLRAFLGVTFVYAGIQKMLDGNFLHSGSPDYIGTQLKGFAQGTPIGGLLHALVPYAVPVGIGIALAEIAIGLGTLAGIAPVAMALGGFLINLTLTLSATWHVHPYFLGSDSMYAIAWLAYGLGIIEWRRRERRAAAAKAVRKGPGAAHSTSGFSRREFVRGAALAGATVATAGVAAALESSPSVAGSLAANGATTTSERGGSTGSTGGAASGASGANTAPPSTGSPNTGGSGSGGGGQASSTQGTAIADLASLPVGGAVGFQAPGVGPAALVRLGKNDVVAFSRTCTHAGCLVGYNQSAKLLVCPCHGAEYDPARGAAVVAGPAPLPLEKVDVVIDSATGQVVLPS